MSRYFAILSFALAAGCASAPDARNLDSYPTREIVLSSRHPQNDFLKVRLIAIAKDGTTTIQVVETGEMLRAVRGDFFVPAYFGRHGLQLIGASPEKHKAYLLRIGGKARTEPPPLTGKFPAP